MAVFSVEIADADVGRVLDALAANYNWPELVGNPDYPNELEYDEDGIAITPVDDDGNEIDPSINNPETKAMFANRMVRRFLSDHVISHEIAQAKKQALDNINTDININDPQV